VSDQQRVVIDTSTLVGAVLRPDSVPRQAFMAVVRTCEFCVSSATLDELREVLQRPKFDRYAPLQARLEFWALVRERSRLWEIDTQSEQAAKNACRDMKDAKFLALALACQAMALLTSDADLLVLHPWQGVPILTPSAFLQKVSVTCPAPR
jgi:putative PIN family toxin of toxin-antitoxin system